MKEIISNLRSSRLLKKFSLLVTWEKDREQDEEYAYWCQIVKGLALTLLVG